MSDLMLGQEEEEFVGGDYIKGSNLPEGGEDILLSHITIEQDYENLGSEIVLHEVEYDDGSEPRKATLGRPKEDKNGKMRRSPKQLSFEKVLREYGFEFAKYESQDAMLEAINDFMYNQPDGGLKVRFLPEKIEKGKFKDKITYKIKMPQKIVQKAAEVVKRKPRRTTIA